MGIENLEMVKVIQMAWLNGEKVRVVDPAGFLRGELAGYRERIEVQPEQPEFLEQRGPAVYVGIKDYQWPEGWLRLRPKILMAGMGCNKGTRTEEILELLTRHLQALQSVIIVPAYRGNHCRQARGTGPEGGGPALRS